MTIDLSFTLMAQQPEDAFHNFAIYGNPEASGNEMAEKKKLCKECKIIENVYTITDVDNVFPKVRNTATIMIN